jgi:integrase
MKTRTGYVYKDSSGAWIARITYTDGAGVRRSLKRSALSKTEARRKLDKLRRQFEDHGQRLVDGERKTFAEVAKDYAKTKLVPAHYVGEKKVGGFRSLVSPKIHLRVLVKHFGQKRLRLITHADIEIFKRLRFETPTRHGGERQVASVNREMALLNTIFNWSVRQGWLLKNPFQSGPSLITKSDETSRSRTLTYEEEERLLASCTGRRAHLQPIIVVAIDTGLRRNEILTLAWRNVDFAARRITVTAFNAKTNRVRMCGMTDRVFDELAELWDEVCKPDELVFGVSSIKRSFASACKEAGLSDVHFHDLRHCFCTRAIAAGLPAAEVLRISGHATLSSMNRYLNPGEDAVQKTADALDELRRRHDLSQETVN